MTRANKSDHPDNHPEQPEQPEAQPTMLEQMGGVVGLACSALPVVVFVLVNSFAGLVPAIWSALGAAFVIGVVLAKRKGSIQPAISAVFGVGLAAFIAYRTGSAKGFFLFGIWQSLVYGGAFLLSIALRWPLAGVVWSFLNGQGRAWREDKASVRDYDIATLVWALVFLSRFAVQRWLYDEASVGWLAFARIAMGYPLMAIAVATTVWAVRRSDKRLAALKEGAEAEEAAEEERLRARYGDPAGQAAPEPRTEVAGDPADVEAPDRSGTPGQR
ncbi:DUF3159 domain-containing protein [Actinosynnema mirum]|uniref:DUF3159 domain-containing protein n=2 Tax=Actinosynnema TaxID=40566 RepID=C6WAK3_ACTMD|nr:DUF3159 domain-containing protein [Actinosynnema mirum]ACU35470.1 hypothetical protein Amir_1519 [Actinosynnema mirum DSM 43827]